MIHTFSIVMAVSKSPEAREQLCLKIKFMVLIDQQGLLGAFYPMSTTKNFAGNKGKRKDATVG